MQTGPVEVPRRALGDPEDSLEARRNADQVLWVPFREPLGRQKLVGAQLLREFPADFKISIFRLFRPWRCPGQALETHLGDPGRLR